MKMALHRREAVVHAVERIDTKAPVDVIGLIAKPKQANDGFISTADLNSMQEAGRSQRRRIGNADAETRRSRGQRGEKYI